MEEPPLKRQKVEENDTDTKISVATSNVESKYLRESDVGITEYINRDFDGFDCILKYRYLAYLSPLT